MTTVAEFALPLTTQFQGNQIPDTQIRSNESNPGPMSLDIPRGRTDPPTGKELTHLRLANAGSTGTPDSSSETRIIERGHPDFERYRKMAGPRDNPQPLSSGSADEGHTPYVPSDQPLYSVSNRYLGRFGLDPKDSGVFPPGKNGDKAVHVSISEETCDVRIKGKDSGIHFTSESVKGYLGLKIDYRDGEGNSKSFVVPRARLTVEGGKLLVVTRSETRVTVEPFYKAVERYANNGDQAAKDILNNFINKR
jgi:hypothetical protein